MEDKTNLLSVRVPDEALFFHVLLKNKFESNCYNYPIQLINQQL